MCFVFFSLPLEIDFSSKVDVIETLEAQVFAERHARLLRARRFRKRGHVSPSEIISMMDQMQIDNCYFLFSWPSCRI